MCSDNNPDPSTHNATRKGSARGTNAAPTRFPRHGLRAPARSYRHASGFSLIEIMVVVVIIGILAGAVAVGVDQYLDSAKTNRAKSDIATIVDALETYKSLKGNGYYPTQEQGLSVLDLRNNNDKDPWGRPYEYTIPGGNGEPYEVYTLGRDGRDGGDGIDADIYSWQVGEVNTPGTP